VDDATRREKNRMQLLSSWMSGPLLPREKLVESLEALIVPGDRIVLEGDNQKQADFLSRSLVKADPKKLHDLHLIISSISRPEHLTLFELGIARKIDFAYAGSESLRVAQLLEDGVLEIGAIHTYVELYPRLLTVLRYANVSSCKPPRVIGRSIRPRKGTDAMHRLPWPTDRERIAFELREKDLNNGVNIFDALMNAAWIDKDAIPIPQFVDCLATAVRVSSVEDLQQVPFNDLLG
jgi:hypothetical protein